MNAHAAAAAAAATVAPTLPWSDVAAQRTHLLRFARARLQDPALAEDVVQDVFEAVIAGRARFGGDSSLRTWLTGVLKHKIVDLVRSRARLQSLEALAEEEGEARADLEPACPQPQPQEQAEQRQLLQRALQGIQALPAGLRAVMELRVLQDEPTDVVCRQLAISEQNLFVRLHRARRQLAAA